MPTLATAGRYSMNNNVILFKPQISPISLILIRVIREIRGF